MGNFSKNLLYPEIIYPEISTHKSLKLSSAPENGKRPEQGYVYQWQTVDNNGDMYINFRFHEGNDKQYKLGTTNSVITPAQTPDFIFQESDIVNDQIVFNNNAAISLIGLYNDQNKTTYTIINVPVVCNSNSTYIDMTDIDCPYGGIIKFAQGTVVINYQDDVYTINSATQFDAQNGLIQIVNSIADNALNIEGERIINLEANRMIKIIVNNSNSKPVQVQGEQIQLSKFLVCYINVFGSVKRIGEIIEIKG